MANATETKFGDPGSRIAQTARWTVLLRPKQPTLGSLVLVCREPVQAFSAVSVEAFAELQGVVSRVEAMLREVVAYERINYLMLMMVDPHVHFHVLPRYASPPGFAGRDFPDAGWPGPPDLKSAAVLSEAERARLQADIVRAWPKD